MSPAALLSRGPILIDGDSDLCNVADVVDGKDQADGIVNCETADGSAERPYVVSGWNVTWDPAGPCKVDPSPLVCQRLPPCSTSSVPAAVAICGTRKHIVLETLAVGNAEVARQTQQPKIPAAAILVSNVDNLRLSSIDARAGGIALYVESGKPIPTLPERLSPVVVEEFRARSWTENLESGIGLPPSFQALPELSIVRVADSPVVFRRINVDASLRDVALIANASADMPVFELTDSFIANGSSTTGLGLYDLDARIERNRFQSIGVSGASYTASSVIEVYGGNITIRQNHFTLSSDGIFLSDAPVGHIRENVFTDQREGMENRVLKQDVNQCAEVRVAYNDIPTGSIENGDNACPIDARYNWWDGPPRVSVAANPLENPGAVETVPYLSRRIADLPAVNIATPSNGTQVHGKVLLSGTSRFPEDMQLHRIEASASESEWELNQSAPVAATWHMVWDVAGEPLGPFALYVRACGPGDDCGLPTRIDVLVIEKPLAPIAVFEASRRVVMVGQPVQLDASLSYSPQGRPVTSFRFDLGNGMSTPWQSSPLYEARFEYAGNYPVSVQVVDAQALVSENLPQQVIRVHREEGDADGGKVPSVGLGSLLGVLGLLIVAWRGRT